ncbi:MAG: S41 family peptidase [Gemmatimonadaceae bacterium]
MTLRSFRRSPPTPRRARRSRLAVLLLGVAGGALPGAVGAQRTTTPAPRAAPGAAPADSARVAAYVTTFDSAWRLVYERHFDSTFTGVDWIALRDELRPRAAAARDEEELRAVIRGMLQRLRQSHFALIPRQAADGMDDAAAAGGVGAAGQKKPAGAAGVPGDAGLALRVVDGAFVVARVDPDGAAARAGVRPGWVVRRVGGAAVDDLLRAIPRDMAERQARARATLRAAALFDGPAGTPVTVELVDGGGRALTRTLVRTPERGEPVKFGNLPPLYTSFERERLAGPGGTTVGVLRFNVWMAAIAGPFAEAVDVFRDADGIVVDLRGNPGGVGALVMGTAGQFLDSTVSLGTMRTRSSELHFVANPRRVSPAGRRVRPYDGPVVVLVDGLSGSTSELFAGGMQAVGRARVVGDTSAGQALPALMQRLPNGDVLYHAVADFFTPRGDRIEGRGVIPDDVVPLTRRDLLAGRDPQLAAALRWIAERKGRATTDLTHRSIP